MFNYPKGLFTDVRIDNWKESVISFFMEELTDIQETEQVGVFVRVYDGKRWYWSAFTGKDRIQEKIDELAAQATPDLDIENTPVVKKLQANKYRKISYQDGFSKRSIDEKVGFLSRYPRTYIPRCRLLSQLESKLFLMYNLREFYSSKGAELYYDDESFSLVLNGTFVDGERSYMESYEKTGHRLSELDESVDQEIFRRIRLAEEYVQGFEKIDPGKYEVVLSPEMTGLFCHESVGHKAEADFFVGNPVVQSFWSSGEEICDPSLSITDYGAVEESIYLPFDDEGTKCIPVPTVDKGKIGSLLTDSVTAAQLDLPMTGNARAMDYTWEPMVRQRTSLMTAGSVEKVEDIFAGVKYGIFCDTYLAGAGDDVFSMTPGRSYLIEDGKITKPVMVNLIYARCKDCLASIDARTVETKMKPAYYIRCGKPPQLGLATADGGPYVHIRSMNCL